MQRQLGDGHGAFEQATRFNVIRLMYSEMVWGPPEMPYALNLVKLGFLVFIPGASNWPSEPSSIQEHPVIVAEQKIQNWSI